MRELIDHSELLKVQDARKLNKLSLEDQWLFELMLQIGIFTQAEFSPTVKRILIMQYLWLVLLKLLGLLKTLGQQVGEKMDILDLLKEIPVQFAKDHHLLFDLNSLL
jgi:hypothetical protein